MARLSFLALIVASLIALVAAGSAPTFCKCTCFKNSTIIPLGPESEPSDTPSLLRRALPLSSFLESADDAAQRESTPTDSETSPDKRSLSRSCSECTKAFCLKQGIDFCEDAEEEDVVTMCFQRDSNKDKIIVWGFMLGTIGLLGWAAFKHVAERRAGRALPRQDISYAPVSGER